MQKISAILILLVTISNPVSAQWTELTSGTLETLNEIFFPVTDTGYVAGNQGTLLRTYNGGDTWTTLDMGTDQNLNDLYFIDSQNGYVVGDSGYIAQTADGGNNWTVNYLTNTEQVNLSSVFFTSVLVGYAGGTEDFNHGIILKTIDGGGTWQITNTPLSFLIINYKRIVFPVADTGYAITRGMCMKSIDAGNNWFITDTALVNSQGMFSILEDAYFFSADTGYIVGWYNPFTGYTVNGGENWVDQLISLNQWYSIDFPSRQTGYLMGWGNLMKTIDGGTTWQDISVPIIGLTAFYSMDFTDINTGYACGDYGIIIKTTNGGITGVKNIQRQQGFTVYPNPTTGAFQIRVEKDNLWAKAKMNLVVYSLPGELVYQTELSALNAILNSTLINLPSLPRGLYYIKLSADNYIYTSKVLIQ